MYETILEYSTFIVFNNFYILCGLYKSEKIVFVLNTIHAKKHNMVYKHSKSI